MIKTLQKLKCKKGFTLIEIIVVLVILAILVAVALPTMFGYVEEARAKAFVQDARVGLLAAQWVVSEYVMIRDGIDNSSREDMAKDAVQAIKTGNPGDHLYDSFMAKVSGVRSPDGFLDFKVNDKGNVVGIAYDTDSDDENVGYIIVIDNGVTTTHKKKYFFPGFGDDGPSGPGPTTCSHGTDPLTCIDCNPLNPTDDLTNDLTDDTSDPSGHVCVFDDGDYSVYEWSGSCTEDAIEYAPCSGGDDCEEKDERIAVGSARGHTFSYPPGSPHGNAHGNYVSFTSHECTTDDCTATQAHNVVVGGDDDGFCDVCWSYICALCSNTDNNCIGGYYDAGMKCAWRLDTSRLATSVGNTTDRNQLQGNGGYDPGLRKTSSTAAWTLSYTSPNNYVLMTVESTSTTATGEYEIRNPTDGPTRDGWWPQAGKRYRVMLTAVRPSGQGSAQSAIRFRINGSSTNVYSQTFATSGQEYNLNYAWDQTGTGYFRISIANIGGTIAGNGVDVRVSNYRIYEEV